MTVTKATQASRPPLGHKPQCEAGQRFGKLTAVSRYQRSQTGARWWWTFRCDCGNEVIRQIKSVRNRPEIACDDCMDSIRPLGDADRAFVEENLPIARRTIACVQIRYGGWARWNSDIESAGMFGLIWAAVNYDPSKHGDREFYVIRQVRRRIRREVTRRWRLPVEKDADEYNIVDPQPEKQTIEQALIAEELYGMMNDEEACVVRLHNEGWSFEDIAVKLNGTFGTIIRRYGDGIAKAKGEATRQKIPRTRLSLPEKAKPLSPKRQELAAKYMPMARAMAKPYKVAHPRFKDEFDSMACLALVESARGFVASKGYKFATYARFIVSNRLKDVLRDASTWEKNSEEAVETFTVRDKPPDDKEGIAWLLKKLPPRNQEVMRLVYVEGKSNVEIAQELGYSQANVSRLHTKSLEMFNEIKSSLHAELEERRLGKSQRKGYLACRVCGTEEDVNFSSVLCYECLSAYRVGLN